MENIDIWDLFEAFNKLLKQIGKAGEVHQVSIDDTPLALHAADILDSLQRAAGTQPFEEIFTGRNRAEMIGLFLALLELIRRRRVRAAQERSFGPICIVLLDDRPIEESDNEVAPDDDRIVDPVLLDSQHTEATQENWGPSDATTLTPPSASEGTSQ